MKVLVVVALISYEDLEDCKSKIMSRFAFKELGYRCYSLFFLSVVGACTRNMKEMFFEIILKWGTEKRVRESFRVQRHIMKDIAESCNLSALCRERISCFDNAGGEFSSHCRFSRKRTVRLRKRDTSHKLILVVVPNTSKQQLNLE